MFGDDAVMAAIVAKMAKRAMIDLRKWLSGVATIAKVTCTA